MRSFHSACTRALGVAAVLLCSLLASRAFADAADLRKADQLFRNAKQLLADEDFAHACPMLDESFKLDPATGTLLALAFCHEREGKLASALRDYNDVVARAKNESRSDRESAARERALALQPRLSTLTVKTANVSALQALEVHINGAAIALDKLDTAMAVDGGTQTIEVSAQGKKPWRTEVRVAKSADAKTVIVPALVDDPSAPLVQPAAQAAATHPLAAPALSESRPAPAPASSTRSDEPGGLTPVQWVGLGAIGTGLVGLGVGTIFAANAISLNHDSAKGCIGDVCSAGARQNRLDARSAGNAATIAFIAGGSLAVVGVSMYLLGQRSASSSTARASLSAAPWVGPHAVGGFVQGSL